MQCTGTVGPTDWERWRQRGVARPLWPPTPSLCPLLAWMGRGEGWGGRPQVLVECSCRLASHSLAVVGCLQGGSPRGQCLALPRPPHLVPSTTQPFHTPGLGWAFKGEVGQRWGPKQALAPMVGLKCLKRWGPFFDMLFTSGHRNEPMDRPFVRFHFRS